jgi:hypothetical protein
MPMKWLFEDGYGASFGDPDTSGTSIHPETAVDNSKDMAVARSCVIETSTFNYRQGFGFDPPVRSGFPTNSNSFNNLPMQLPSVTGADGTFMREYVRYHSECFTSFKYITYIFGG